MSTGPIEGGPFDTMGVLFYDAKQAGESGRKALMLSIPHLVVIFVVALIVFGPEKLPELARNLGKVMAEFKRTSGQMRATFEEHLRDIERETDERRIGGAPPAPEPPAAAGAIPAEPPHAAGRNPGTTTDGH